jgi:hypothetical protein
MCTCDIVRHTLKFFRLCVCVPPHTASRLPAVQAFHTAPHSRFTSKPVCARRQGLAYVLNQIVASATMVSLPTVSDSTLSAPSLHELIATLDEPVVAVAAGQQDRTFVRVAASLHRHDVAAAVAELRQVAPVSPLLSAPTPFARVPCASSRDRAMALFADYLLAHGHHAGAALVLRHVLWRARDRRGLQALVNFRAWPLARDL